jgi:hypothetical protein
VGGSIAVAIFISTIRPAALLPGPGSSTDVLQREHTESKRQRRPPWKRTTGEDEPADHGIGCTCERPSS